jgi:hypothetical protein
MRASEQMNAATLTSGVSITGNPLSPGVAQRLS